MPDPRRAAVLGSPIEHSLSPVLHMAAYAALGLAHWSYTAIECDEAGLPALIAACDSQWGGLSLTMPLKRAVLPLLDRTEPVAVETGGANTVVFAGGERHGYNTDVPGMVAALAEAGVTAPPGATILGAGATACAALAALRATGLASAVVLVRDQARAGDLLAAAGRLGMEVDLRPFDSEVRDGDLLVSTVPAGAADFYAERAGDSRPGPAAVLDVAHPPRPGRRQIRRRRRQRLRPAPPPGRPPGRADDRPQACPPDPHAHRRRSRANPPRRPPPALAFSPPKRHPRYAT